MLHAIVLAGGKGARMQSSLPKPVLSVNGRPMISHLMDTLQDVGVPPKQACIVHSAEESAKFVIEAVCDSGYRDAIFTTQESPRGTGHAARCGASAIPTITSPGATVILYGDVPLLTAKTLSKLISTHCDNPYGVTLLTTFLDNPTGYGRIQRCLYGEVRGIVEERDASESDKQIREVNTGIVIVENTLLPTLLDSLDANNAQREFYLTDIIGIADKRNIRIGSMTLEDPEEVMGANTPEELQRLNELYQKRHAIPA